jgi:hypothetical protein
MSDTYQNWVDRVTGGRDGKPLHPNEFVKSSSGEPFGTVEFIKLSKKWFIAEVGKKGKAYIYHLYPRTQLCPNIGAASISHPLIAECCTTFYDAISRSFLDVFKREDQIEAEWVEEMRAWAVRVSGWTDSVWGDDLAVLAIDKLERVLEGKL